MTLLKKIGNYIFSLKFLKHLAIVAAIYAIVIFSLIFILDGMTNHGEKIKVPNLSGKNVKTIASMVQNEGLDFEVLDSVYMPELAQGTIISQDPLPTAESGVFVKEGRIIKLRVSKRTQLVEVPSLIDKSQRFAESILLNRGFKFTTDYKATTESHGAVIQQTYRGKSIKEGTRLPIGSMIVLTVGRNEMSTPILVPDLMNLTIIEARQRLSAYPNVTLNVACDNCVTSSDSLNAIIQVQSPEYLEGAMMQSGGSITVFAEKGMP